MPKPIELSIIRPRSTPLSIVLVAEHLPAPVRDGLDQLVAARTELVQAEHDLSSAKGTGWASANERVTTARQVVAQSLGDFAGVNAASTTAIKDAAAVAFESAMASANEHLNAALDALADADRAAQLWYSARPGKPVLRYGSQAALDAKVHQQFGMVRSDLRELLSALPDALD